MRRRPPPPVTAALALAGTVSAAYAWRDLNRRTPDRIRGNRRFWRIVILLNPGNSLLYWLFGRR
jgi:hypothetical protein